MYIFYIWNSGSFLRLHNFSRKLDLRRFLKAPYENNQAEPICYINRFHLPLHYQNMWTTKGIGQEKPRSYRNSLENGFHHVYCLFLCNKKCMAGSKIRDETICSSPTLLTPKGTYPDVLWVLLQRISIIVITAIGCYFSYLLIFSGTINPKWAWYQYELHKSFLR